MYQEVEIHLSFEKQAQQPSLLPAFCCWLGFWVFCCVFFSNQDIVPDLYKYAATVPSQKCLHTKQIKLGRVSNMNQVTSPRSYSSWIRVRNRFVVSADVICSVIAVFRPVLPFNSHPLSIPSVLLRKESIFLSLQLGNIQSFFLSCLFQFRDLACDFNE